MAPAETAKVTSFWGRSLLEGFSRQLPGHSTLRGGEAVADALSRLHGDLSKLLERERALERSSGQVRPDRRLADAPYTLGEHPDELSQSCCRGVFVKGVSSVGLADGTVLMNNRGSVQALMPPPAQGLVVQVIATRPHQHCPLEHELGQTRRSASGEVFMCVPAGFQPGGTYAQCGSVLHLLRDAGGAWQSERVTGSLHVCSFDTLPGGGIVTGCRGGAVLSWHRGSNGGWTPKELFYGGPGDLVRWRDRDSFVTGGLWGGGLSCWELIGGSWRREKITSDQPSGSALLPLPDGSVAVGEGGEVAGVSVWARSGAHQRWEKACSIALPRSGPPKGLELGAHGVIVCHDGSTIYALQRTGEKWTVHEVYGDLTPFDSLSLSPDGSVVVTGSYRVPVPGLRSHPDTWQLWPWVKVLRPSTTPKGPLPLAGCP